MKEKNLSDAQLLVHKQKKKIATTLLRGIQKDLKNGK